MRAKRQSTPEEQAQILAETQAPLEGVVGESVLAFGYFTQPGYVGSSYRSQVQPGYSILFHLKSLFTRKKPGWLPVHMYLAMTPTRVLAVSFRRAGATMVPAEVVRTWGRATVTVEVEQHDEAILVALRDPGEQKATRLESFDAGSGMNDAVLAMLRR